MTERRDLTDEEKALILELRAAGKAWVAIARQLGMPVKGMRVQVDPDYVAHLQIYEKRRNLRRGDRNDCVRQYNGLTYAVTERWEDRKKPEPPQVHVDVSEVKRLHSIGKLETEIASLLRPVPYRVIREILGPVT